MLFRSKALDCGTEIIGVNNRDLKTFDVDLNTSIELRKLVPENRFFVSESGIQNAEDIRRLQESAADAVLIGETLMRSGDKTAALDSLRDGAR